MRWTASRWLAMEVLAARYRLGCEMWPFDRRIPGLTAIVNDLEAEGYVYSRSGVACREVGLTDKGIEAWTLDKPWPSEAPQ